jgi:hypothetical protein
MYLLEMASFVCWQVVWFAAKRGGIAPLDRAMQSVS